MSDFQTICYNLNEPSSVQERYTSKESILIKNPPFDLRNYSLDFLQKMKQFAW